MVRPVTTIPFFPRYTTRVQAWVYVVSIPAINNVVINNAFISILFDLYIKRIECAIGFLKLCKMNKILSYVEMLES